MEKKRQNDIEKKTMKSTKIIYKLESKHKHILVKTLSIRMMPSFPSRGFYSETYADFGTSICIVVI